MPTPAPVADWKRNAVRTLTGDPPRHKVITRKLLPKQLDFVKDSSREVLYSGSWGAGKTRGLCEKLLIHANIPGNRVGLCRKTLVSLKATTLKTLLDGDGDLPPVLPKGSYVHNKSDCTIKLLGAGEIYYFGLEYPEKIGSLNLGCVAVDEGVDLTEPDWLMLLGRCRNTADPIRQIFSACNPGPPSHFLAKRFGLAEGHQPAPGTSVYRTNSQDNFFLPKDYVDYLDSLTGTARQRYRDGLWVGFDGLVYSGFDRAVHVKERNRADFKSFYGFVDEGYKNPAVLLIAGVDGDGRVHIVEEFYKSNVLPSAFVEHCKTARALADVEEFVVDPSASGLIAEMQRSGLKVTKAQNSIADGIRQVTNALGVQGDDRPRLSIDPSCKNLLIEFESYVWSQGSKETPVKQLDHALDALRYGLMRLSKPKKVLPLPQVLSTRTI